MREMKYRVIRNVGRLGLRNIGDILYLGGGVADMWLRAGLVEAVLEDAEDNTAGAGLVECAALRVEAPPVKRRRGRPRKART